MIRPWRFAGGADPVGEIYRRGRPNVPPALPVQAMLMPTASVAEHEAKAILGSAGIPVTKEGLVEMLMW